MTFILERLTRGTYIVLFLFTGIWALFLPDHYAAALETTLRTPVGRGEIQGLGSIYLLSAVICIYCWYVNQLSDFYKMTTFVLTAITLSRMVSFIRLDFDQQMIVLTVIELVLLVWSVSQLRKRLART